MKRLLFTNITHQCRSLHSSARLRSTGAAGVWAPTRKLREAKNDSTMTVLETAGYIYQAHSGVFHMLPLGLRVLNRISRIVDREMGSIGAHKVALSSISTEELWTKSGRYEHSRDQLFGVKDRRESRFILAPTHEEEITALVAASVSSGKDLPLRLYQIGQKYRDETRPRQGLLRAREFLMKDLYTFDQTAEQASEAYAQVRAAYDRIFSSLGLPVVVASADSGMMGGKESDEYHMVSTDGEDTVFVCDGCNSAFNVEVMGLNGENSEHKCPKCGTGSSASTLTSYKAIELAHTFNLGTRYTVPFSASVSSANGQAAQPLYMGCYGIGISRVLGALASKNVDKLGLNWRPGVAPYDIAVLARTADPAHVNEAAEITEALKRIRLPESLRVSDGLPEGESDPVEVLFEGRESRRSLIWRLNDADSAGYPIIVLAPSQPKGMSDGEGQHGGWAEVQCRQLGVKSHVKREDVGSFVKSLLFRLLE